MDPGVFSGSHGGDALQVTCSLARHLLIGWTLARLVDVGAWVAKSLGWAARLGGRQSTNSSLAHSRGRGQLTLTGEDEDSSTKVMATERGRVGRWVASAPQAPVANDPPTPSNDNLGTLTSCRKLVHGHP